MKDGVVPSGSRLYPCKGITPLELASAEPVDCVFTHFLPDHFFVRFDEAEEEARLVASVICNEGLRYATRSTRFIEDKNIPIQPAVVDLLKEYLGADLIDAVLDPTSQATLFTQASAPSFTISDWQTGVRNLHSRRRMLLRRRVHDVAQQLGPDIRKTLKHDKASQYNTRPSGCPRLSQKRCAIHTGFGIAPVSRTICT